MPSHRTGERVSRVALALALIAPLLLPGNALADPPVNGSRLGLDVNLFRFQRLTLEEVDAMGGDDTISQKHFSLASSGLGLSAGIVRGAFFGGGRLRLDKISYDDDSSSLRWSIQPMIEVMSNPGGSVRLFGQFGGAFGGLNLEDDLGNSEKVSSRGFFTAVGLHAFATDSLSFDPQLVIGWERLDDPLFIGNPTSLTVMLAVGMTGWFDRDGDEGREAPSPTSPPASPEAGRADERLEVYLPLDRGHMAFSYNASRPSPYVAFEVVRLVESPELAGCDRMTVHFDGRSGRVDGLEHSQVSFGSGVDEQVTGSASATLLAAMGVAEDVTLDFCGERFELDATLRDRIRSYYQQLRDAAAAHGLELADPSLFAPSAPAPDSTPSDDTAAPEAPGEGAPAPSPAVDAEEEGAEPSTDED